MKTKRSLQSQVQRYEFLCTWLIYVMAESLLTTYTASCIANQTMYPDVAVFDVSSNTINREVMSHEVSTDVTGAVVYFTSSIHYYISTVDMYLGQILTVGNSLFVTGGSSSNPLYTPFYGFITGGFIKIRLQSNNSSSMTLDGNNNLKKMNMQIYCFSH